MSEIIYPLLAALAVMLVSLAGVVFAVGGFGRFLQRNLTYLATFAGGVFIIVAWHLAEEAVHEGGWLIGVSAVILGAALMESINFLFPAHHHHDVSHDHAHTPIDGRRVLLSDSLHNVGDGILLVGAFSMDIYVGIAATVGVLLHEFVQEISEFFVLKESGYTNARALTLNFIVSGSILIGLLFAFFLASSEILLGILAGLAAGGFISVLLHDLLPHAVVSVKTHGRFAVHVIAVLLGAGLMFSVQALAPHEEHEEDEHAEETSLIEATTPTETEDSNEAAPLNEAPQFTSPTTSGATDAATFPSAGAIGTSSRPER
jgi:zinc and cadmium transporter